MGQTEAVFSFSPHMLPHYHSEAEYFWQPFNSQQKQLHHFNQGATAAHESIK